MTKQTAPERGTTEAPHELRWFKATFTTIGAIYVLLASSALVRGVAMLRDFGVPDAVVASPFIADFFSFFYQLMAALGALMILIGRVTRDVGAQRAFARAFSFLSVLAAFRDLSTSDSRFGDHLYKGDRTLGFVLVDVLVALVFGLLSFARASSRARD
ncbi:MAG: hypothetical protein U0270_01275 [Labilithrix sp.]